LTASENSGRSEISRWLEFYSRHPMFYDPESEEARDRAESLRPFLRDLLTPPGRTLDLACGSGVFSFLLEELGHEVVGVDAMLLMIDRAREVAKRRGSRVRFIRGDARQIPLPDDSFDYVVFLGNSLPHFSIEEMWTVLGEIARVLVPGGGLLVEYSDFIQLLATGGYRDIRTEPFRTGAVISYHSGYSGTDGVIKRLFHYLDTGRFEELEFHLWAPWIIRFVAARRGFVLERSTSHKFRWYLELYRLK